MLSTRNDTRAADAVGGAAGTDTPWHTTPVSARLAFRATVKEAAPAPVLVAATCAKMAVDNSGELTVKVTVTPDCRRWRPAGAADTTLAMLIESVMTRRCMSEAFRVAASVVTKAFCTAGSANWEVLTPSRVIDAVT